MESAGFLCGGNTVVLSVDGELISLSFNDNRFIVSRFNNGDDIVGECKEISIKINELYGIKYFPRIYYSIFEITFGHNLVYLLEKYNGTTGSTMFYPCLDYGACMKKIEALELS